MDKTDITIDKSKTGGFGRHSDTVGQERKEKKVKSSTKKITIVFRQNRSFDLHIGREMIHFEGRESKQITAEQVRHPDFKQVSNYFIVKGV